MRTHISISESEWVVMKIIWNEPNGALEVILCSVWLHQLPKDCTDDRPILLFVVFVF